MSHRHQTMKSMITAIEPKCGNSIYFPNVEQTITSSKIYEFIEKFLGTTGRNSVPDSIISRFRIFNYPEQSKELFQKICIEIRKSLYKKGEKSMIFKDNDAKNVASFMFFILISQI